MCTAGLAGNPGWVLGEWMCRRMAYPADPIVAEELLIPPSAR
jgi:hypothetical protein